MSDASERSADRVAAARRGGDADDTAEALMVHANDLVQRGRFGEARLALDEAAAIHHARGRAYDEARCTQFAATLCRFQGRFAEAEERARRALTLAESKGPIAVSSYAELGEIASAQRTYPEAADAYRAALDAGQATGLVESARAALLRKRAAALTVAEQPDEAIRDLEAAHQLLAVSGDAAGALRTLIEQATVCQRAGSFEAADRVIQRAMGPALARGDHAALADLHLLVATQALNRRDAASALAAARAARKEALAGNEPTSYIAAAVTIARLADTGGDRPAAYEALAVGWATLGDLLGPDAARAAFEPGLKEFRERWGAASFDDVKQAYEASRRQLMTDGPKTS